jgi:hypothetical protein
MKRSYRLLLLFAAAPLLVAIEPASTPLAMGPLAMGPQAIAPGAVVPAAHMCHVDTKDDPAPPAKALLAGYGAGGFGIRTRSREAQAYFDNGMQLAHAFAHAAATSAFRRAEALDPTCAMCVWGEAWSRGPTINFGIDDKARAQLVRLTDKAAALAADAPPKERAMIAALQKRYLGGGGSGDGDLAFARAMDDLAKAWPDDDAIAVLAADAWMIPAANGRDRDKLGRAIELLETVLRRSPDDTGAIHFYIHATEMNGVGVRALPYAERLQALAPAASHLVHMPSHTYFWAGRFRAAELSNIDAVAIDDADAARARTPGGAFALDYHAHNVQFGAAAALMDGDARGALPLAAAEIERQATIAPDQPFPQMVLGTAYFVYGRYGSPAELAALTDPGPRLPYGHAMWLYAQGEAAARRGDVTGVKARASAIAVSPGDLRKFGRFQSQGEAMIAVARLVLTGRAAMMEHRFADAEAAYRRAADLQEARLGTFSDPPSWWYPVRRSVAAALEAQDRPQAAAAEARKAMTRWASDPVGLQILAESDRREGRTDAADREVASARSNWIGDVSALPLALR